MICIEDMQGEEHHCQEEQEFLGNACQDKNNQSIEMRVLP
jgi:hypothetical protein